jgi:hypothetical protein
MTALHEVFLYIDRDHLLDGSDYNTQVLNRHWEQITTEPMTATLRNIHATAIRKGLGLLFGNHLFKYDGYDHEDAREAFSALFSIPDQYNKKLLEVFQFDAVKTRTCMTCLTRKTTVEKDHYIGLPLHNTSVGKARKMPFYLPDLIRDVFKTSVVDHGTKCASCSAHINTSGRHNEKYRDFEKQFTPLQQKKNPPTPGPDMDAQIMTTTFSTYPRALCIQLLRLEYKTENNEVISVKNTSAVEYSDLLTLDFMQDNPSGGSSMYLLVAVLHHHGQLLRFGHYTAVVRTGANEWTHYDDVHPEPRILHSYPRIGDWMSTASVFFFVKV